MTDEKKREINPEIDTTRIVNIDDKPFDVYINGKVARHLEAKEEQTVPLWVAQAGAKHLVDRVLQEKYNIKDTFKDTPLRKSLFAQILPDMAEERDIQPLSNEDFQKAIEEQVKKQDEVIASIRGEAKAAVESKEETIEELKAKIDKLEKNLANKKPGRPAKGVTLPNAKEEEKK